MDITNLRAAYGSSSGDDRKVRPGPDYLQAAPAPLSYHPQSTMRTAPSLMPTAPPMTGSIHSRAGTSRQLEPVKPTHWNAPGKITPGTPVMPHPDPFDPQGLRDVRLPGQPVRPREIETKRPNSQDFMTPRKERRRRSKPKQGLSKSRSRRQSQQPARKPRTPEASRQVRRKSAAQKARTPTDSDRVSGSLELPKDHRKGDFPIYNSPKLVKKASMDTLSIRTSPKTKPGLHARGLTNEQVNSIPPHKKAQRDSNRARRRERFPSLSNVPSLPSENPDLMLRDSTQKSDAEKDWTTVEWIGAVLMAVSLIGLLILGLCALMSNEPSVHAPEQDYAPVAQTNTIQPAAPQPEKEVGAATKGVLTDWCMPSDWGTAVYAKILTAGCTVFGSWMVCGDATASSCSLVPWVVPCTLPAAVYAFVPEAQKPMQAGWGWLKAQLGC